MNNIPHESFESTNKSSFFAQVVTNSLVATQNDPLPSQPIKGDSLCMKIAQKAYEKGIVDCQQKLHGIMVLNKGERPYRTKEVSLKLSQLWKTSNPQWKT